MLGRLGRLVALVGIAQAAFRFAKNNPDKVSKIVDQVGHFVDERTKGRFHSQIDGAVRKVQDATNPRPQ